MRKLIVLILIIIVGVSALFLERYVSEREKQENVKVERKTLSQKSVSRSQSQDNKDKTEILNILEEISTASVEKDMTTLDRILPDNYVLIHMTGYKQPKKEWLEEVRTGSMEYFSSDAKPEKQKVTINGNKATVSSTGTVEAKIGQNASRQEWTISSKASFKKINGQWVIQKTDAR